MVFSLLCMSNSVRVPMSMKMVVGRAGVCINTTKLQSLYLLSL